MAFGKIVNFEDLRDITYANITTSYKALGNPLGEFARIAFFSNATDAYVLISLDGIKDKLKFAPGSYKSFDFTTNKVKEDGWFLPKNKSIYIKYESTIGTTGSFWVEVVHGGGGN